jgi:hypothetical protein
MLYAAVMEEGHQESKRLSYMVKLKHEFVLCAEGKGNRKAHAIFGVDGGNQQVLNVKKEIHWTQERTIS